MGHCIQKQVQMGVSNGLSWTLSLHHSVNQVYPTERDISRRQATKYFLTAIDADDMSQQGHVNRAAFLLRR